MTAGIDFSAAEDLLLQADFQDCRPLWYSSNYVYLAQMCAGDEQFAAVYKPEAGENPLWDFPTGELFRREVAAYRLSQLLDWPFIPPTVARDGPHGRGAVQVFIKHDQRSHFFEQRENPALVSQLQRIAVFDYVANNADRKGGHCLLDDEGRIWGIDHGLCFHTDYKMRTVMWDWADEPIPPEWLEDLDETIEKIEDADDAALPFVDMIEGHELAALIGRSRRLLVSGRFPLPGPHRSYPWPLV